MEDPIAEIAAALEARRAPELWAVVAYEHGAWAQCDDPVALARVLAASGGLGAGGAIARALAFAVSEEGRARLHAVLPGERERTALPALLHELRDARKATEQGSARAMRWLEAAVFEMPAGAGREVTRRWLAAIVRAEAPDAPPLRVPDEPAR